MPTICKPTKETAKADIVHKTIAAVKIKCKRVAYPDSTTGKPKEIFMIEEKELDAIEKELSKRC